MHLLLLSRSYVEYRVLRLRLVSSGDQASCAQAPLALNF